MFKYIKESYEELTKVTWPTFNQLIKYTIVIVIFTAIAAAVIGTADYLLNRGYQAVLNYSIANDPASVPDVDVNNVQIEGAEGTGIQIQGADESEGEQTETEAAPAN